jgi:lipoate---protein ligase
MSGFPMEDIPEYVTLYGERGEKDTVHLLDLSLPSMPANLALDEALLLQAEAGQGGEVLRLWEWPAPAVVLGSGGKLAEDVDEAACEADGVPILRRSSGGGTVLLGPGCLLYSLVLAFDRSPLLREIPFSYAFILDLLRETLAGLLPDIVRAGTSDLAAGGRKFSGNSQQRKRSHVLHHGTLLYHFDFAPVGRYLRMPLRQPDYRGGREHGAFLTNLPATAEELKARLRQAWQVEGERLAWPRELVDRLVEEKYSRAEWVRRR